MFTTCRLLVRSSCFHSFFCYQTCEHDMLKTIEPILMLIGTISPRIRAWNDQLWGHEVKGQRSKSYKAEDRLEVWRMHRSRLLWLSSLSGPYTKYRTKFRLGTTDISVKYKWSIKYSLFSTDM